MAKVPFSKLQTQINNYVTQVEHEDKNGKKIYYEIKHYLPFKDKLNLVTNIINQSIDDNNFYNPMRVKLYTTLEITYAYTNLSFTDKQKEDPFKVYDLLVSNGIFNNIVSVMSANGEWDYIQNAIINTIDNIYKYQNSAMGILDAIKTDYETLNLDATEIQKKLGDPENMQLLREVLTKLG